MLRDTIRLTSWCVMCSCCTTSPYGEVCTSPYGEVSKAEGGIGSGEIFCYDIYPARPITTVSLAANTYCMMDGQSHSSCASRTVGSRIQFSGLWGPRCEVRMSYGLNHVMVVKLLHTYVD